MKRGRFAVSIVERRGQAMTEYALLLAAVAVVAYVAYFSLGDEISELIASIASDL